ncbi:MAG: lipocalin family protein [Proteobacteria bacterium]|uniref:lipocalin family protein n=1 Tax=Rudaea sp. TaxID=2136325 RepID=UPI0032205DA3|nr:lipocalin family protein [Pseudomonadota bacterium]
MPIIRFVSVLCVSLGIATTGCTQAGPSIRPVAGVDLQRFAGRWYVIASIPTRFERGGHNSAETYRQMPDGTMCTWFRQRPNDFTAPVKLIHSSASVVAGSGNGEWSVRFFGFLHAQYLIGWLSADYDQVMVVRDARDYIWYMAREPQVSDTDYHAMLSRAAAMGYDIGAIEKIPQRWPEVGPGSDTFEGNCP